MTSKLQIYDVFAALVPGVLLLCVLAIGFPDLVTAVSTPQMPSSFVVLALTVLAVFIGHIIQALVSLLEPLLYRTWGGRPSEQALSTGLGDRYFPQDAATRIAKKLKSVAGTLAGNRSLFLFAMTLAESDKASRTAMFNASYAYHRALLMLTVIMLPLMVASSFWGALHSASFTHLALIVVGILALVALVWYRSKQRALYYVREVLLTAERLLDSCSTKDVKPE